MSDVTFTAEQIVEIRRRVEAHCREQGFAQWAKDAFLAAFPLKVTRYRTFTMTWGDRPDSKLETYRINGGQVEFLSDIGKWYTTNYGTGLVASFAEQLVAKERWTALAAFADVCARPVEEVDA